MRIRDFNLKFSRVIVICLIVSVLTGAIVYATSPTQPFTINRGIYPGAPSFTVWVEDGTYFAKNSYGVIAYSGVDAQTVIQNALDTGNIVFLSEGIYPVNYLLIPTDGSLIGTGSTSILEGTDNIDEEYGIISNTDHSNGNNNIMVKNLKINGKGYALNGLRFEANSDTPGSYFCDNVTLENIWITDVNYHGFELHTCRYFHVKNINVDNAGDGTTTYHGFKFTWCYDGDVTGLVARDVSGGSGIKPNFAYYCSFNNLYTYNVGLNGIDAGDVYNCTFNNIICEGGTRGVRIVNGNYSEWSNIEAFGCLAGFGVQIQSSSGNRVNNVYCYGNLIGFEIKDTRAGVPCQENQVTNVRVEYNTDQGLTCSGDYNILVNIIAKSNGDDAIYIVNAEGNILSNIYVDDTGTDWGIIEDGTADLTIITNFNTYGCTNGIKIIGTDSHANLGWNATSWLS